MSYREDPSGNPVLLFTGVACVAAAIILDAVAYRRLPSLSPEEGSQLILEALVDKPRYVTTPVGTLGGLLYRLSPSAIEALFRLGFEFLSDEGEAEPERNGASAGS